MSELASRLKTARALLGISQADLAKRIGAGQSTIASIENGRNNGSGRLVDIAKALNVRPEWLARGEGPMNVGAPLQADVQSAAPDSKVVWPFQSISASDVLTLPPVQLGKLEGAIALAVAQLRIGIDVAPPTAAAAYTGGNLFSHDTEEAFPPLGVKQLQPWEGGTTTKQEERLGAVRFASNDEVMVNVSVGEPFPANDRFEKVPKLADVHLAAGEGIENHSEAQTGVIQFRRSFLRSVGADVPGACVVYAKGDSMEPTIRDGAALLLVPTDAMTMRELVPGAVYAINYDGKMIVKSVVRDSMKGQWVARSFNRSYRDIDLENAESVRVLGRIVWVGARLT